jgi:tetratricopeptide (TPR) repeat protein
MKFARDDLDGALMDYDKAIELNPKLVVAYSNRGDARRAKGDLDNAMADCDKAIELNSNFPTAHSHRGEVKRAKGDFEGAMADFNKAIELKPDLQEPYKRRGSLKEAQGDLIGAKADYDKAAELKAVVDAAIASYRHKEQDNATSSSIEADLKKISVGENALAIRTDFSDESAWKSICEAIQNPENEFEANLDFINDKAYDGLTPEQLPSILPENSHVTFGFIIDRTALSQPDHPILVVDLKDKPGRTFRVIPSAVWAVENNLSIANMDFDDFMNQVDENGIFRGI